MKSTPTRQYGALAAASVAAIGIAAFLVGFYVLPGQDPHATVWERICRAAGVVPPSEATTVLRALPIHSSVVVPPAALAAGTQDEAGRGATLALRCTMCHGAQGRSGADAPNLAGQYPEVIYKQLVDFQHGARVDAVMGAMVATLTDANMLDLSHYYAGLPRARGDGSVHAPALVRVGDPMRNIAPCASCHGREDGKIGAPALEGEPQAYLQQQLTAFLSGARSNDVNAAMRNEARLLTQADIATLSDHYAHAAR